MIKAFLFDVDGVLYDSMPHHARSWIEAFKLYKIRISAKQVYVVEGMPDQKAAQALLQTAGKHLTQSQLNEVLTHKRELFDAYKPPEMIRGAKPLLRALRKKGLEIGLVTGSFQHKTIERLEKHFGITESHIVTGKEVKHGKPHPEPYLLGMKHLQIKPNEAMVVENAPLGIRSAKAAGARCVALKTGLLSTADLKKEQPDFIFHDCQELLSRLDRVLGI